MDTDGSRQICVNVIFFMIEILLLINSRVNILNAYIICNMFTANLLKDKLLKEGYYIKNVKKGVYLIYPVLYGERD